ncbi:hypothetical protein LEP1GSC013_0007 [Leptospira interrogans serovar Valbuzzi str. Duyster]|nr:hypothetical protein LEP1GSC013_0007 [Leptospira interrogans serovar Valbuzzi str. Duyster]ENO73853.1 hypothetical protein LEP1GSC012_2857 [Leptospira interrogans serovar Valbuzzi str. Valbuzzi]
MRGVPYSTLRNRLDFYMKKLLIFFLMNSEESYITAGIRIRIQVNGFTV